MMIVITFFIFLWNHFNGFNNVAYVVSLFIYLFEKVWEDGSMVQI